MALETCSWARGGQRDWMNGAGAGGSWRRWAGVVVGEEVERGAVAHAGEHGAAGEGNAYADDTVAAKEVFFFAEHMHGATLAARVAVFASR